MQSHFSDPGRRRRPVVTMHVGSGSEIRPADDEVPTLQDLIKSVETPHWRLKGLGIECRKRSSFPPPGPKVGGAGKKIGGIGGAQKTRRSYHGVDGLVGVDGRTDGERTRVELVLA